MYDRNPLEDYPNVRSALYLIGWIINGALVVGGAVLLALGQSPTWFIIVGVAFNAASAYGHRTAGKNVPTPEIEQRDEDPADDIEITEVDPEPEA